MKGKQRHPTTALVSSGLIITLALLPLYLGQLEAFKGSIGIGARLTGLSIAILAFLFGAWSMLSHSGRPKAPGDADEPAATETWLKAVDLVWKFAAAIAIVVTTNWFAVILKEEQDGRKRAEQAASEKSKAEAENNSQAEAAALRIRESVVQLLVNTDPYVRQLAVANAFDIASSQGASALSVAETLFTVAVNDPSPIVKAAAAKCLPDGVTEVDEKFDFSKAVLQLAEKQTSRQQTSHDQTKIFDYRLLNTLNSVHQFAIDPQDRSRAKDLATKLSQSEIAAATEANTRYSESQLTPQASPTEIEQQKVDSFAPAVILTAADHDPRKVKAATAVLQNTTAETVSAAIQKLPDTIIKRLPARVYLHIANEDQRSHARTLQSELTDGGYISPGIQNVAGRGYVPDTLEVRYFDERSRSTAEHILEMVKSSGAKDGRVSYVIPSANDLRISPDIKSHFEVWAGKNSF